MQFLADESCDFAVVRALRSAGYDVRTVTDVAPGATDEVVLDIARREQRLLLTEDKDFGQLVFADQQATGGVLLIRWPFSTRTLLADTIVTLVANHPDRIAGQFSVVTPARVRFRGRQGS